MSRRRTIRFTIPEEDFQQLLVLARTERKNIEDLFRESVPEVMAKYSILVRLCKEKPLPRESRRKK